MTSNHSYASFMLRLQWMQNNDCPTWVVSVQSTKTGETRWFPNLDALFQFLQNEFVLSQNIQNASQVARQAVEAAMLPIIEHQIPE